jgi:hypothetical protein
MVADSRIAGQYPVKICNPLMGNPHPLLQAVAAISKAIECVLMVVINTASQP